MLGDQGRFDELIVEEVGNTRKVKGFKTTDSLKHYADVTVIACGGWTAGLLPEVEGILETTAGSVVTIQLPKHREDLWSKVSTLSASNSG